jgi:hypothetical protein
MPEIHIYSASTQPATRFVDRCGEKPIWFRYKPHTIFFTECCLAWRWAKYVRVQVYYDGLRRWCVEGRGCKQKGRAGDAKR